MTYKQGSRGEVVKRIQRALKVFPDGIFGELTCEAVKQFQATHGLTVDGIVGPATLAKLLPQLAVSTLKKSSRHINEIIIHCTATPEGKNYTVDDIRRWHRNQGWSDIGYHYVIYRDGSVHVGRDVNIAGAHCRGHNSSSIGVCYVGGTDSNQVPKDTRTLNQKAALLNLLSDLREMYPKARIVSHHDYDRGKACPSFDATKEYRNI